MSTLDAYTPGGVSSVLAATSAGKQKSENKAVLALFSKVIPKYDYSTPKAATGDAAPVTGKKRKHKNKDTTVQKSPKLNNDDSTKSPKAHKKKKPKHDTENSLAENAKISEDTATLEKKSKKKQQHKGKTTSEASVPGKKLKRKSETDPPNMSSDVDGGGTEGKSPKKRKSPKRKQSGEPGEPDAKRQKPVEDAKTPDRKGQKDSTAKHKPLKDKDNVDKKGDSSKKKKKKKTKKHSPPGPGKDARTVFVGNLPATYTRKKVMKVFKKAGKIESVRFRSAAVADLKLPRKAAVIKQAFHSERHNINAYVVYKEKESALKALELNGKSIDGWFLRVDSTGEEKQHDHKKCIFIGNLPFDAEENALRDHFDECGDIANVRIVRDKKTGLGKGIGYIQFADTAAVGLALKFKGEFFQNRKLRVSRSSASPQDSAVGTKSTWKFKKQTVDTSKGKASPEFKKPKKKLVSLVPSGSKSPAAKKSEREDFQGTKAQTTEKLKHKKPKPKDRRQQTLKEIFGGAKDTRDKQAKIKEKKKGVRGDKPKRPQVKGKKFTGKKGKAFARNRIAKKMKHKGSS